MAIEIYPQSPKPSNGIITTQKHRTLISGTQGGGELRRRSIRFPKRNVSLIYNYLTITNRNTLQNFFKARDGSFLEFWYIWFQSKKWVDEYVGRGGPLNLIGAIQDDGGTFTSNTVACVNATANGMILLPAIPAQNDAYYIGGGSQFDKASIVIGTPGVGTWTIVWEYHNGSAWTALSGVSDGTTGFTAAAGSRDVTFTVPANWAITSIYNINAYWVRARVSAYTSVTTQPKGSGATVNSKYYDLHGVTTSGVSIYVDGVLKTAGGTDYTFVSGGGAAGSDRIVFVNYPSVGSLITSDFTGFLRIKGRFSEDELEETDNFINRVSLKTFLQEVQW